VSVREASLPGVRSPESAREGTPRGRLSLSMAVAALSADDKAITEQPGCSRLARYRGEASPAFASAARRYGSAYRKSKPGGVDGSRRADRYPATPRATELIVQAGMRGIPSPSSPRNPRRGTAAFDNVLPP